MFEKLWAPADVVVMTYDRDECCTPTTRGYDFSAPARLVRVQHRHSLKLFLLKYYLPLRNDLAFLPPETNIFQFLQLARKIQDRIEAGAPDQQGNMRVVQHEAERRKQIQGNLLYSNTRTALPFRSGGLSHQAGSSGGGGGRSLGQRGAPGATPTSYAGGLSPRGMDHRSTIMGAGGRSSAGTAAVPSGGGGRRFGWGEGGFVAGEQGSRFIHKGKSTPIYERGGRVR